MKHVVIVGNGIAGITAARHIRKLSKNRITVISSETPHFYSRTALMYIYTGQLTFEHTKPYEDWFWKKNKIDLIFDHAEKIEPNIKSVLLRSGQRVHYDELIIATGSKSNLAGVAGEKLHGVNTLYGYPDLQNIEQRTRGAKKAVIVGGGLIGVEMAEMLHSRKISVTMLVREQAFWNNVLPLQEAQMISDHISSHGIEIKHNRELKEIISDGNGGAMGVRTKDGEEIASNFICIAIGVQPNLSLVKDSDIATNRGILVNEYMETNIPGIFAIGDCVERRYELEGRKKIEQVWYTARMMGEVVAQTICGDRTPYTPGPWFNSAKFFDIEYQTYGNVPNILADNQDDFYWQHETGKLAMHIVWNKESSLFQGINAFGLRLRHERFDRWLREKKSVQFVMQHLPEANFDPEFTRRYESRIREVFKRQIGGSTVMEF